MFAQMRLVLPPVFSILLSLSILGLIGYDFWSMPGTYDTIDTSYAIFSVERITIDGQWGHVLCMAMAVAIIAIQIAQFLLPKAPPISGHE